MRCLAAESGCNMSAKQTRKSCVQCGASFYTDSGVQKYCSDACVKKARAAKQAAYQRQVAAGGVAGIKQCKWCGAEFETNGNRRYCSDECMRWARNDRLHGYIERVGGNTPNEDVGLVKPCQTCARDTNTCFGCSRYWKWVAAYLHALYVQCGGVGT